MKENNRHVSIMEYYLKLTIALYVALTIDFAFIGIITYYALKGQFLDKYIYTLAAVFFISQVLIIYMFSVGLEATNTSLVMTILSLLAVGFATMFVFQNLTRSLKIQRGCRAGRCHPHCNSHAERGIRGQNDRGQR